MLPPKDPPKENNNNNSQPNTLVISTASPSTKTAEETPPPTDISRNNSTPDVSQPAQRTISIEGLASYLRSSFTTSQKAVDETKEKPKMRIVRPVITQLPFKEINKFCVSMSGCGFLGSYHFGAIKCLVNNGKPVLSKLERVSGSSAGSLVASVLLLCPEKIDLCVDILYNLADELNTLKFGALTPGYFLNEKLVRIVDAQLPKNVSAAKNKLYVSVTEYKTRENVLLCEFADKEELLRALMASCFIPMYSMGYRGIPPKIADKYFIDGGYSNNLPDFEDIRTITISPFSGVADISPTDELLFEWKMRFGAQHMNVNMQNLVRGAQALFPPNREILKEYYRRGYKDTYRFLLTNNLLERNPGSSV